MVVLLITLNLLFNFSKPASIGVVSKTSIPHLHSFRLFATFKLLGCISENYDANLCEIDLCFGSTTWSNFHHKNITRLTSLEPSCHFCYFANCLTVSIRWINFLFFKEPLIFAHRKSFIIEIRFISNVFASLTITHHICTRGKFNKAIKNWLSSTHLHLRTQT